MKKAVLLIFISLIFFSANATHIVGGEMNYKYLGGNNYEIRLTVYRDCWVGVPPFDNPAVVGIFDINNNFIDSIWMPYLGLDTLPPEINDPCVIPPTDFCYEVTTYIDTINLPPLTGGYIISYQRCCRNVNILNIVDPDCAGATYWAYIPGPELATVNSNPVFNNWPPPFVCANKPWVFDHSATDIDGDSLVYEIFTPYTGLDAACPIVTTSPIAPAFSNCPNVVTTCPNFPVNPPFINVIWQSPYSLTNVLGGVPLTINPSTGILTATPSTLGYFVYGVKCKEYRNGVLLSETLRDFQLIVKSCPSLAAAAAVVPDVICGTNSVNFTNTSDSTISNTYYWNFGDPSTTADTSSIKHPSYTYPDTGTYSFYLVAYATGNTACNDTFASTVTLSDEFSGTFSFFKEPCENNRLQFSSAVNAPPGTTVQYNWNFGDGYSLTGNENTIIPPSPPANVSNNNGTSSGYYQSPVHIYTGGAGTYNATLYVGIPNSVDCYDTISSQTINLTSELEIFVPNTFTPNNDGKNDVFRVRGPAYGKFYFAVYNRWGQLMFETNDPSQGWDGNYSGRASDPGVFGWYLRASCGEGKEEIFKKGNVTLIR